MENTTTAHTGAQQHKDAESARIADFYDHRAREYGIDPRASGWGSRQSQRRRLQVLTEIADLSGHSVLDVGCGLGELHEVLMARGHGITYTGYDISPSTVKLARARFPHLDIRAGDILGGDDPPQQFDYVLASGLFNLRTGGSHAYLAETVDRMFRLCRFGVAFNTLSARCDLEDPGQFFADPTDVLDICMSLTSRVVLRHDYMPHDFTVYVFKFGED